MSVEVALTARQRQILDVVRDSITRTGLPPTRAEVAQRIGVRSPNAADEQLRALERKGMIDIIRGASRGVRLRAAAGPETQAPVNESGRLRLPVVGVVAAGQAVLAPKHIERMCRMPAALFSRRPDYLLRVTDGAMRGAGIVEGDLLAVEAEPSAVDGQVVVVRLGRELLVRRLRRGNFCFDLVPAHPAFSTRSVPLDDASFSIEGVMVGLVRSAFQR